MGEAPLTAIECTGNESIHDFGFFVVNIPLKNSFTPQLKLCTSAILIYHLAPLNHFHFYYMNLKYYEYQGKVLYLC